MNFGISIEGLPLTIFIMRIAAMEKPGKATKGSILHPQLRVLLYFNGQFIVAYRGKTNPYIHLDFSEDGIHWGGGKRLSTAFTTLTTPNFAVVNNMLSLFYVNECPNCTLRNFVYAQHGFTRRQIGPGIFRPGRANMACFFL
jgi:hypothetical protein